MNKNLLFTFLTIIVSISFLSSCKKKCVIEKEDTQGGAIIAESLVYPENGMQTDNLNGTSEYHIHANSLYADTYEYSIDGGYTKQNLDYNQYHILAYPMTLKCNASFERTVTIDATNQIVTYNIKATECKDNCDELRTVENYVLVPAFPESWLVVYNPTIEEK